jgi:hypothetical protein
MKRLFLFLRSRWRMRFGFCPACNSDAPAIDTCPICHSYRIPDPFPPSNRTLRDWRNDYDEQYLP